MCGGEGARVFKWRRLPAACAVRCAACAERSAAHAARIITALLTTTAIVSRRSPAATGGGGALAAAAARPRLHNDASSPPPPSLPRPPGVGNGLPPLPLPLIAESDALAVRDELLRGLGGPESDTGEAQRSGVALPATPAVAAAPGATAGSADATPATWSAWCAASSMGGRYGAGRGRGGDRGRAGKVRAGSIWGLKTSFRGLWGAFLGHKRVANRCQGPPVTTNGQLAATGKAAPSRSNLVLHVAAGALHWHGVAAAAALVPAPFCTPAARGIPGQPGAAFTEACG